MYKTFGAEDRAYLTTLIPADRLFFGEEISEDYSHDELGGISRGMPIKKTCPWWSEARGRVLSARVLRWRAASCSAPPAWIIYRSWTRKT